MMGILLALLLSTCLLYGAEEGSYFSASELQRREIVIKELLEAAKHAESALPPCEGLELLSKTTLHHRPSAKLCPKSFEFFAYIEKLDQVLRKNCREVPPASCSNSGAVAKRKIKDLRLQSSKAASAEPGDQKGEFIFDFDEKHPTGELKNMDCIVAVVAGSGYRRHALLLANKRYGDAEDGLDSACSKK